MPLSGVFLFSAMLAAGLLMQTARMLAQGNKSIGVVR